MAVIPTGAIYKSLVFDGEDSRDYGVYITGQAVYNAPERDVEMISIPGRNGSFALDKGRFQNIEVSYPAGIFADNETDFAQGISDFRNLLCSRNGYVRLSDEYHPDEYRMAVYKSGLEVEPAQLRAGEFDIVFDCKPQRFLTSGEEPITIGEWRETETASGSIATFDAVETDAVKSLTCDIEPIQDLHGYDKPWSGGAGKQLIPYPYRETLPVTRDGITFTDIGNGRIHIQGHATSAVYFFMYGNTSAAIPDWVKANTQYSLMPSTVASKYFVQFILYGSPSFAPVGGTFTTPSDLSGYTGFALVIGVYNGADVNDDISPMLEYGSTASSWSPYSNICPISGHDEVNVWDDPKYGGSVEWNQIVKNGYSESANALVAFNSGTAIIAGHKYYLSRKMSASLDVINAVFCRVNGVNQNSLYIDGTNTSAIKQALYSGTSTGNTTSSEGNAWIYQGNNSNDVTVTDFNIIDLTEMFGAGNEPTTVDEFKALFPLDYYEYNAGETTCVSAVNGDPYEHYTTDLFGTRYGGTVDVVSGVLTVDRAIATLDGNTFTEVSRGTTADGSLYVAYMLRGSIGSKEDAIALADSYEWQDKPLNNLHIGQFDTRGAYLRFVIADQSLDTLAKWKAYLAENPIQLCYELATPTTVQLTAQEVELLVGTNNIWNDCGDTTVEYGTAPNILINPTLFEAAPMLEVEGYGEIGVNADVITIQNGELGEIKISDATQEGRVFLDVSNLNADDAIYSISSQLPYATMSLKLADASGTLNVAKRSSVTGGTAYISKINGYASEIRMSPVTTGGLSFRMGWSHTYTTTLPLTITINGTATDCTLTLTTVYNGGVNTISLVFGGSDFPESGLRITSKYSHPVYYGSSTKVVLPSPMYIDLDLGEAYGEVSDEITSFNGIVQMPANPPTLKAGANEITFDSTITDLKVIPRWWRV